MNSSNKRNQSNQMKYSINQNDSEIVIQIVKGSVIEAKQGFNFGDLKQLSVYFYLFNSIQNIYEDLITLGNENKICIEEKNGIFYLLLAINFKGITTIKMEIKRQIQSQNESNAFLNRVKDQMSTEAIYNRFDAQDKTLQKIESKLEMIENMLLKQFELKHQDKDKETNLSVNSKLKVNQFRPAPKPFEITHFNIEIATKQLNQVKSDAINPFTLLKNSNINMSVSLLNEEDKTMISNWIAKGKQCTWNLLYNPIQGQDTYKECLRLCYNKPSIAVLIESNTGCKFGGYTTVGWDLPANDYSCKLTYY